MPMKAYTSAVTQSDRVKIVYSYDSFQFDIIIDVEQMLLKSLPVPVAVF